MLRLLVVLLLMANAGFFAWHQGWLDPMLGTSATPGRDPQRLKAQVHPERLIVQAPMVPPSAPNTASAPMAMAQSSQASSADSAPTTAMACLEAGPFTPDEQRQVQQALGKTLPANSWTTQTAAVPGLWLVYMGPYADQDTLQRKQLELRRIKNLNFEEVRSPANLVMGLSLGRFNIESQAQATLESMKQRGVRTARVITLRQPMDLAVVRIPQVQAEWQARLSSLPVPAGKGFVSCETR
jgi:hypothetical protein